MTKQETFDTVARHLLTQKQVSSLDGHCMYRGPNGLQCAIGCLIPDSAYKPEIEGLPADCIPDLLQDHDLLLCANLQGIHDSKDVVNWRSALASVATQHGLDPKVLEEFCEETH